MIDRPNIQLGTTYDENGNKLVDGYWWVRTFDHNGNQLSLECGPGVNLEEIFDVNNNMLSYKKPDGFLKKQS